MIFLLAAPIEKKNERDGDDDNDNGGAGAIAVVLHWVKRAH